MTMTQIGDVTTWWDVHGDGDPLVLLHPGGADSRAYDINLDGAREPPSASTGSTAAARAAPRTSGARSPSTR